MFLGAMSFWGVDPGTANVSAMLAYIMARACPPVGVALPPGFDRPVLPTTVAGDLDALRRGLRLQVAALVPWRSIIQDELASILIRNLGGRVRRLKSAKRPIVWDEVQRFCDAALARPSPESVLGAFALAFAFLFGTRVSELLSLKWEDVTDGVLLDGRPAIAVVFVKCKNRQSLLTTHEPFTITAAHPTLMRCLAAYRASLISTRGPLIQDHKGHALSREWFARLVAAASPGGTATPHSVRVGLATELWASGASLSEIMAAGRWTSPAAVLYIIGSLDASAAAIDKVGGGGLMFTSFGLQQQLRTQRRPFEAPKCDPSRWASIVAPLQEEGPPGPLPPPPPAADCLAGPQPNGPRKRLRPGSAPFSRP
jgi:integrase